MPDPKRSEAAKQGWATRRANQRAMQNKVVQLVTNSSNGLQAARYNALSQWAGMSHLSPKHNHYRDFGYPEENELTFDSFYRMYMRHGIGHGAVKLTTQKTWESLPRFLESDPSRDRTPQEEELEATLLRLRFWQHMVETDRRSMVGAYSALILRIGDNKKFNEPVDGKVPGGLKAIKEVIPAWEGQLQVANFQTDETQDNYGHPTMYQFNESAVMGSHAQPRSFEVHPDRVLILSDSGTVHDQSALKPGYNALLDCEKISGAGGEGFWKNAKAAPVLTIDKDVRISEMARAMDVEQGELFDAITDQVRDYNTGLDQALLFQGVEVDSHDVNLPIPEHFFMTSLQMFCASVTMPVKILIGMQTGERASQEDQSQWAKTNMSRRDMRIIPFLYDFLERLKRFGMIKNHDKWAPHWDSLMEDSPAEKMGRSKEMAEINQSQQGLQPPFTHDEIREAAGYDKLDAKDLIDLDGDNGDYADNPDGVEEDE